MATSKSPKRQRQKDQRRAKIQEEIRRQKQRRTRRLIINASILAVVIATVAMLVARSNEADNKPDSKNKTAANCTTTPSPDDSPKKASPPPDEKLDQSKTYVATMETSLGTIEIELDDATSPCSVNAFISLAKQQFYDGLVFHRIVKGFALQGGDPKGDGSGGPGYKVVDKPPKGFKYEKGVVAMAKGGADPAGTSGSQFFIVPGEGAGTLPPDYAVLGRVIKGDDVVEKINNVPTGPSESGEQSKPLEVVTIVKVTIKET